METPVFVLGYAIPFLQHVKRGLAHPSAQFFERDMEADEYVFGRGFRPYVFHIIVDGIQGNDGDRQYDFLSGLDLNDFQSPIPEGYVSEFQIDDINLPETAFDAQQKYSIGSYLGRIRILPRSYS